MDPGQFNQMQGYLHNTLSSSEIHQFDARLRNEPEFADEFMRFAFEESVLRDWARAYHRSIELDEAVACEETRLFSAPDVQPRQNRSRFAFLLTAVIVCVFGMTWLWLSRSVAGPVATFEQVQGHVELTHTDGSSETVASGRAVESNQKIRLRGERATATLLYPDGSQLMLVGDSRLQLGGRNGKRVEIEEGFLGASVAEQSQNKSMQFITPTAQIDVLGTRFSMEATSDMTDVAVIEGCVKLTRIRDGQAVDLKSGMRSEVKQEPAELTVKELVSNSLKYDIDFENGLPADWGTGEAIREGVPPRGAVRAEAVKEPDGVVYGISTAKAWREGLFSVQDNTHLNFTYKLDKPDWFQVFISARALLPDKPPVATYRFKDERLWWPFQPGKWRTAKIPLSAFGRVSDWSETPLGVGELPFELLFTSKDNNLSLVIDRIWITNDGPGEFTVEEEN
ncbi:fec operon regulator FecR [Gimesia alba]|uniref:Fec operon regulator FecR n=1 Tax=Gimesia alba TaxID=2527973 RepID=A0A517RN29_9PLAN|nr:FecR family protein [Gimesia alba]QDT45222.1 fec operon regulator FecR [Gimesia alba]